MEHRLITGGEQYLPFARSRIKALKATGLAYASQQFEVDGCSVKVRIEPGQEYITLSGGSGEILSGLIRGGEIVSVPVPTKSPEGTMPTNSLRSFKPTPQAWKQVLNGKPIGGGPSVFSDEPRLAVVSAVSTYANTGSQNIDLCGSMYSGKMAKLVQLIMGYGKIRYPSEGTVEQRDGVTVVYDFKWRSCHGIVTSAEGKPWLVWISRASGVLAMPLPMFVNKEMKYTEKSAAKLDAAREAFRLFGGIPSGKSFPVGAALTAAIADGNVLQLLSAADMNPFYFETGYAADHIGWSFNQSGSEAHNVCFKAGTFRGVVCRMSAHYKLVIGISQNGSSAALVEVESAAVLAGALYMGEVAFSDRFDTGGIPPFGYPQGFPISWDGVGSPDDAGFDMFPHKVPMFVCHVNDVITTVYTEFAKTVEAGTTSDLLGVRGASSTTVPLLIDQPANGYYESYQGTSMFWVPYGARDCYVVSRQGPMDGTRGPAPVASGYQEAGVFTYSYGPETTVVYLPSGETIVQAQPAESGGYVRDMDPSGLFWTTTYFGCWGDGTHIRAPRNRMRYNNTPGLGDYYRVRCSSLGTGVAVVHSIDSDWTVDYSTTRSKATTYLYRGAIFSGVASPLTDAQAYSFIGYI